MANLFSFIDIFGTVFQFTTFKKEKFKTTIGGVMTSLCVLTIMIFTYLFGKDFFFRKNPIILQQEVSPLNYSDPFILNQQNMPIIWRIDDNFNNPVNFSGILYPKIMHYTYLNNSNPSYLIITELEITKCTADLINNPNLLSNLNLEDWYCVDWSNQNLTFGGGWDGNFIDYFDIELWVCSGSTFSSENCTDINDLKNLLNIYGGIYFDIFYPQFYLVPTDLVNPMRIEYTNYFFQLDFEMRKLDKIYFSNYLLLDDVGWIMPTIKQTSLYASNALKSDYSFYSDLNYGILGQDATFYGINFYFQKQYTMINRSYTKIQELLAVVGGFSQIIIFACSVFSRIFNTCIRDELLYNDLFEYIPSEEEHNK